MSYDFELQEVDLYLADLTRQLHIAEQEHDYEDAAKCWEDIDQALDMRNDLTARKKLDTRMRLTIFPIFG